MLRPVDIQNKEFDKKLKGYDCDQVDDFLDMIIADYENMNKELQSLKDRIGVLTDAVERYKQMETTMQKSIDMAKHNADELKHNAELESQAIISKAKLDAIRLAKQIDDEHIRKHKEMLALKSETEAYKSRMKTLCSNLIQLIDDMK